MVTSIFGTFRDELDRHHDRRERIIKTSRDITALSKKIIFSLQRVRSLNCPLPPAIAKDTSARLAQIVELFRSVVPDVTGINSWRYQRQLSGGIQEFIEALSFNHYVQFQTLITLEEIRRQLPAEILVTEEDYIMGLFDLTGEMMRFAVTSLSAGMAGIVVDLRGMRSSFESLSVPHRYGMLRDLSKKLDIMQGSVEKVERAAYGILVRGSERPSGWVPDLSGPAEVESF
ncbi:hypothetical protein ASPZODRAFT_148981 [Penicilliopsis zonata CBS 506.65]|uniref:Translin n=1 Tax=Penicilliopsis zonata CBS 506.65 TaxID=1073090 RepID=A0A1L9SX58_9EURO|nr:hypothetical protein ASPZODRAFT_148981 [Penicilliopsis zonata CBS 506.65]OJJ51764.1 hypothetical protein ASPZODRAFT_148981 [Penicilliopsis zonata CBS 506.65]